MATSAVRKLPVAPKKVPPCDQLGTPAGALAAQGGHACTDAATGFSTSRLPYPADPRFHQGGDGSI